MSKTTGRQAYADWLLANVQPGETVTRSWAEMQGVKILKMQLHEAAGFLQDMIGRDGLAWCDSETNVCRARRAGP